MNLSLVTQGDDAVLESKEGMILTYADILAGKDVGAALAGNNLPNLCKGAWGNLDT